MEKVELGWDEFWAELFRVKHRRSLPAMKQYDEMIAKFCMDVLGLQKGDEILDIACGAGDHSVLFAKNGLKVSGFDLSRSLISAAEKLAKQEEVEVNFYTGDMREINFPAKSFDAITAVYSLFHVPKADHQRLFEKMHRWLNPRGCLLFTYATKEYTGSDEFDGYKEFMGQQLYYSHKTSKALYKDLINSGFKITSTDYRDIGGETFLWVTVKPD